MQELRNRARANLPTVLLTLLSIVQALALEFVWTYIRDTYSELTFSWMGILAWLQIASTLIGIALIWVVYASHVMRLRWVPTTTDSVYPFVIGLLELVLIELLGTEQIGLWMICNATMFALMVFVSHRTMKRARKDEANEAFFRNLSPATIADFVPAFCMIGTGLAVGLYLTISGNSGWPALAGVLAVIATLIYQFYMAALFWERSLSDSWNQNLAKK